MGDIGIHGERFLDNLRIEGTIPEMLETAIQFVRRNMRTKTIIDPETGRRTDHTDYPIEAVREAILNALVHRDYSLHTEGMPIQLLLFDDRLEIRNPGGIYGRLKVDQLGKFSRIPETLYWLPPWKFLTLQKNRYSGIPTFAEPWHPIVFLIRYLRMYVEVFL